MQVHAVPAEVLLNGDLHPAAILVLYVYFPY